MSQLIQDFWIQVRATQALEWTAALFGVLSVLFAQRNHILLYPTGLVSTGIYSYLLSRREAGLYAEALLNLYYFIMTIYGWGHWHRGKNETPVPVSFSGPKEHLITLLIVAILWPAFFFLLSFTPSTVPGWDSFVSATACAGMWLLARRKVNNWLLLNLSNIVAIPLFAYKGYYVTMLLTVFLFVVAIFGYLRWRKIALSS